MGTLRYHLVHQMHKLHCPLLMQQHCRYITYAKNYLLLAQDPVVVLLRVLRRNRCPLPSACVLLLPPPPPAPGTSLLWEAVPLLLTVDWVPPESEYYTTTSVLTYQCHRLLEWILHFSTCTEVNDQRKVHSTFKWKYPMVKSAQIIAFTNSQNSLQLSLMHIMIIFLGEVCWLPSPVSTLWKCSFQTNLTLLL
jgi:hypothetical protein